MQLYFSYNILFILLVSIKISFGQTTPSVPCRKIFRYNLEGDKWFGVITLQEVRAREHLKLSVDMSSSSTQNSSILSSVDLKIIREEGLNDELTIKFPLPSVLPRLTRIELNDEIICSGPSDGNPVFTIVRLEQSTSGDVIFKTNIQGVNVEAVNNKPNNNIYPHIDSSSRFFGNDSCGTLGGKFKYEPVDYSNGLVEHGAWPWMAAVYRTFYVDRSPSYFCTGTLITIRAVITSGQCAANVDSNRSDYIVYLGAHNLNNLEDERVIKATIFQIHKYPVGRDSSYRAEGDISIIELTNHVKYTDFIRPACIWTESTLLDKVVGEVGFVGGWGEVNNKAVAVLPGRVRAPIVSVEECYSSYSRSIEPGLWISEHTLCAGERNYEGPCKGDEGAGLLIRKGSKWILRAVVSRVAGSNGSQSCALENYVVYNDVAQYLDWIEGVLYYISELSEYCKPELEYDCTNGCRRVWPDEVLKRFLR